MNQAKIELMSETTYIECECSKMEKIPINTCQWFYECTGCGVLLKPLEGDCCVFFPMAQ